MVCQKRFYPYEWMDDTEKLNQESLPTIERFCSQLSQKSISEPDYSHATNVYNKMNNKTFTDYHRLFLHCDVLLLADVFENIRNTCIEY